jgi:hypothetical protein
MYNGVWMAMYGNSMKIMEKISLLRFGVFVSWRWWPVIVGVPDVSLSLSLLAHSEYKPNNNPILYEGTAALIKRSTGRYLVIPTFHLLLVYCISWVKTLTVEF